MSESTKVAVVDVNDMPYEEVRRGRVRTIRRKRLPLESGLAGVTLEFSYCTVPDGYFTPRHKHNFDQIRYTLSGVQSTGLGDLAPGECGYFPEGSYYGPQKQEGDCECLVLQFQGPSGERLLSNEEMNATYEKLIKAGAVFENGVYKGRKPDGSPKNKDSYEAIWEEHEGRDLTFPPARYRDPVMMMSGRYRFVPDRKRPGVEIKHLGTFNELRTGIGFLRLRPGAQLPAGEQEDAEIRFLLEGAVSFGGKSWGEGTYFYLPNGAHAEAVSTEQGATFFTISLPMIAEIAAERAAMAGTKAQAVA
jgi:ChrR Cupin-like domain